jgi:histidinol-phosphate aminotransferase
MRKYVRKAVVDLKSYKVNNDKYLIKLDANEGINWFEGLNRYPDNDALELIKSLSNVIGKDESKLIVGNGSSELIELTLKTFLEANEYVVSIGPTFSMYSVFTTIYNGKYEEYKLSDNRYLNVEKFIEFINRKKAKIVMICNPNNPTGTLIKKDVIEKIIKESNAIVVVDEAYVEFASGDVIDLVDEYNNLIVLRTFSKAYSLAGIRLGYLVADEEIINYIKKVKPPYNVNALSQEIGLKALSNDEIINENIKLIKEERDRVFESLNNFKLDPIPSFANFILFKGDNKLNDYLKLFNIILRKFEGDLNGYMRMSIGTKEENDRVLEKMRGFYYEKYKN